MPPQRQPGMTEAEARDLLRCCDGLGGLEAWIARQPWQAAPGGAALGQGSASSFGCVRHVRSRSATA
jgi:hypothetical protein